MAIGPENREGGVPTPQQEDFNARFRYHIIPLDVIDSWRRDNQTLWVLWGESHNEKETSVISAFAEPMKPDEALLLVNSLNNANQHLPSRYRTKHSLAVIGVPKKYKHKGKKYFKLIPK